MTVVLERKNAMSNMNRINSKSPFLGDLAETIKDIPAQENKLIKKENIDMSGYWQECYGDNRMVLMVCDPYWCFVYWDFSSDKIKIIARETHSGRAKLILRIHDLTGILFNGCNAYKTKDIKIVEEASNWYINVWATDCSYCVDIGLLYDHGYFDVIIRSNTITTPRDSISSVMDEKWMMVEEAFGKLHRVAGAGELGSTSEMLTNYLLASTRVEVGSGGMINKGSKRGNNPRVIKKAK
jgi:hypothetical protein